MVRSLLEADALRAFAVFARHLNFTAAARELHLSQPSLHVKIRKLGSGLGFDLYERKGRVLRLTPAGVRLAAYAHDCARRADDLLADLHGGERPVTFAAGRGAVRWVIGAGLGRLTGSGRRVCVLTADREAALAALRSGGADLAVVAQDPPEPALVSRLLARFPQTLLVARDHRLADRREVRLRDLDGLDLVLPPPDRPHRRALERQLNAAGVRWRVTAEVDGWDLLVYLSGLGLGATVVNGCVPPPEGLAAITVRDLPEVRYWACWRPERSGLAEAVVPLLVP